MRSILFVFLFAVAARAQGPAPPLGARVTTGSGAPTNPCPGQRSLYINTTSTPNALYACPSGGGNWFNVGVTSGGSVTSVGLALTSIPWLTVSGSPVTTAGNIGVAPTSAQTSHQVIGTCGTATTFGACALVAGDLPLIPVSTGISGLGTGVATALGVNVGTAGAFVVNGGALGTPSSGIGTNLTGIPINSGISGLGTGVATFLATPSSANLYSAMTTKTGSGGSLVFATGPTLSSPQVTTILDGNGNPFLVSSATASAVDSVTVTNAATANPATVTISATGPDANINLNLVSKGTGTVQCNGSTCGGGGGGGYTTVQNNGTSLTPRSTLNVIPGTGATTSCVDNSGASRTDCTFGPNFAYTVAGGDFQDGKWDFVNSTNGTTAYTGSPAAGCANAVLTNGMHVYLSVDTASTTTASFDYCSLGTPLSIVKRDGSTAIGALMQPHQPSLIALYCSGSCPSTGVWIAISPENQITAAQLPSTVVYNNQANTYSTGLQDFSNNAVDVRLPNHTADPGTCAVGQIEFNSTGAAFKGCNATNTWTTFGGGGTIGGSGTTNTFPIFTASTTLGNSNLTQNGSDGSLLGGKTVNWAAPSTPTFNSGGTTTCDFSVSNVCQVTFTGTSTATTLAATNPHGSGPYRLITVQGATSAGTYTAFPATFKGASQPDVGANNVTIQDFTFDGTNYQGSAAVCTTCTWHGITGPEGSSSPTGASGQWFCYELASDHLLHCNFNNGGAVTITQTICSGTVSLGTSAIASGAKASTVTATCTGMATTDDIISDFNADPTGVTGYAPSANGMLTIIKFPTANTVNFIVANNTASSITPGAITLNYRVVR
ncbi:MAG TPA: hypothetical protein VKX49_12535 [Bryobacteraceae bacterium]|nr:hypothetical protein [Bryobacteraceae bacterium]